MSRWGTNPLSNPDIEKKALALILKILADGKVHSSTQITKALRAQIKSCSNLSFHEVGNLIKQLRAQGYHIQGLVARGYQMRAVQLSFFEDKLESQITNKDQS